MKSIWLSSLYLWIAIMYIICILSSEYVIQVCLTRIHSFRVVGYKCDKMEYDGAYQVQVRIASITYLVVRNNQFSIRNIQRKLSNSSNKSAHTQCQKSSNIYSTGNRS